MVCVWGKEPCFRPVFRWLSSTKNVSCGGLCVANQPRNTGQNCSINSFTITYREIYGKITYKILNFVSDLRKSSNIRMKKIVSDLLVTESVLLREDYVLLKLTADRDELPEVLPGQFVEVRVDDSPSTFLRRPISINFVIPEKNEIWLLVHAVGDGTKKMAMLKAGDRLNCMLPLGRGFSLPEGEGRRVLLVGGGVGTAPLLYLGKCLKNAGHHPTFLLGGRSAADILQVELFEAYGPVCITTEDASRGEKGFVTNHSVLSSERFDAIASCGPKPMMKAVAAFAAANNIDCEVSLENMMACGLGACLCCVEKDKEGHNVCVCKEGPVFNINQLQWLISK